MIITRETPGIHAFRGREKHGICNDLVTGETRIPDLFIGRAERGRIIRIGDGKIMGMDEVHISLSFRTPLTPPRHCNSGRL